MSLVERARALWQHAGHPVAADRPRPQGPLCGLRAGLRVDDPGPAADDRRLLVHLHPWSSRGAPVGEKPYILFLVLGLLAWQWFSVDGDRTSTGPGRGGPAGALDQHPARDLGAARSSASKGLEFLFSLPVVVLLHDRSTTRARPSTSCCSRSRSCCRPSCSPGSAWPWPPPPCWSATCSGSSGSCCGCCFYLSPIIYAVLQPRDRTAAAAVLAQPPDRHHRALPRAGLPDPVRRLAGRRHRPPCISVLGSCSSASVVFSRLERAVLKEI